MFKDAFGLPEAVANALMGLVLMLVGIALWVTPKRMAVIKPGTIGSSKWTKNSPNSPRMYDAEISNLEGARFNRKTVKSGSSFSLVFRLRIRKAARMHYSVKNGPYKASLKLVSPGFQVSELDEKTKPITVSENVDWVFVLMPQETINGEQLVAAKVSIRDKNGRPIDEITRSAIIGVVHPLGVPPWLPPLLMGMGGFFAHPLVAKLMDKVVEAIGRRKSERGLSNKPKRKPFKSDNRR